MINREKIREYFTGKSCRNPVILMIVGLVLMLVGTLLETDFISTCGTLAVTGGWFWLLYILFRNRFMPDLSGEPEVDAAKEQEIELAKQRAMEKLNIIGEQVQNADPVVVCGRGTQPAYVEGMMRNKKGGLFGAIKCLLGIAKKKNDYEDPYFRARIGSDGAYRCSLISTSVFMFGEKQLYVYFSDVDLVTGLVYSQGTHEYFYSDINAVTFLQNKEKVFNAKKKCYEGILFEAVQLFASGCSYTATLFTDMDKSVVDKEFTAMRALIRERKDA